MNSCKIKGRALLFGLNYDHCKSGKLNGCINDVMQVSNYISSKLHIPTETYTDDTDLHSTSYDGIIQRLYDLAILSYVENLEFVWIHYSGHGSYQKDTSGDEKDGFDEGLVPSDYEKKGILIDDVINRVISVFNPRTNILFICDSCHSGTILDLKFSWGKNKKISVENSKCKIKSKTILISGCMDNQTSADAWNLLGDYKHVGALTASILNVLKKNPQQLNDVFSFVNSIRTELKKGGFDQYPCLSTNYNIDNNPIMIPMGLQTDINIKNQECDKIYEARDDSINTTVLPKIIEGLQEDTEFSESSQRKNVPAPKKIEGIQYPNSPYIYYNVHIPNKMEPLQYYYVPNAYYMSYQYRPVYVPQI